MKQEESAREEKLAMEKIAVILANLTSKKTAMVRDQLILLVLLSL